VRDVLALVLLAAVASTTLSATNGVTTLWIGGDVSGSSYGSQWLLWWIGDAMGDLIVAPLLLVWATASLRRLGRARTIEALTLLALLAGASSFVFIAGYWRYPHVLFPLLIWAALRFEQRGAVTSIFVVAAIAIAGGLGGTTPLPHGNTTEVVQVLEGLLAGMSVALLILAAVLAERRATEAELEHAHAGLAEAQELAHLGSWDWTIATNRVTWSDELYRLYGLEPQFVGVTYESFLERVHPEDRERVRDSIRNARTSLRPFVVDHRVLLPGGDVRWLQGRGRVIADDTGAAVRMVGTSQDVTERKRLDELRENILATVSHELRTPLTSIVGFALTLKEKGAQLADDARRQSVEHLAEQAQKLDRLLSQLLDLDRLRHGLIRPTFRATDVGQLVTRIVEEYPSDAHALEVRTAPIVAEVDASKVERIVENLLANAFKHTPPGTKIYARVEQRDGAVLIAVDDRGPGVLERDRRSIFEIFHRGSTTVAAAPGAGIGLSLVMQFAELHGGKAWVEENPGGGASFLVLLPLHHSAYDAR